MIHEAQDSIVSIPACTKRTVGGQADMSTARAHRVDALKSRNGAVHLDGLRPVHVDVHEVGVPNR